MTEETKSEYRIFKFVTHDWEGDEFADIRKGAPMYGLFEVLKNEAGEICARCQHPEISVDMFGEASDDPVPLFREKLMQMLKDIERPSLEEPFEYAECDVMTEEEAEAFIAGDAASRESEKS